MMALGLLKSAPAHAFALPGSGAGKHVVVLGAGLAGLCAAYELSKLKYKVTLLEARDRVGGRVWTVRKGTTAREQDTDLQQCSFDDGLYFNAGPSRIPHHHQLTLHYCRELGVPIEVYNNVNEAAYFFSEGKGPLSHKKIRIREIHNDVRGYMCELLAKAINSDALDIAMTKEDAEKIIQYLRAEGGLDPDNLYKASARRGYIDPPGAGARAGAIADPHTLSDILSSGLMDPDFYNVAEYTYELQMTMFQAVGGMDKITEAFSRALSTEAQLQAEVTSILHAESGVEVTYQQNGVKKKIHADYCICTLPLPVLSTLDHNLSQDVSRAIDFVPYIKTGKIGLQFSRRFWEEDEGIYGGITHTNNELTQIFYPSNGYLGKKGVLIGCYNFYDKAEAMGKLPPAERLQRALKKGALIHPQYSSAYENGFSVSWHRTPHSLGGWALYNSDTRANLYKHLIQPDRAVYFAGEHTTHLTAWMAGALESARNVVTEIHARETEQRLSYPSK